MIVGENAPSVFLNMVKSIDVTCLTTFEINSVSAFRFSGSDVTFSLKMDFVVSSGNRFEFMQGPKILLKFETAGLIETFGFPLLRDQPDKPQ